MDYHETGIENDLRVSEGQYETTLQTDFMPAAVAVLVAGGVLVSIQIVPLPLGDVTGDGKVNIGDTAAIYSYLRETHLKP